MSKVFTTLKENGEWIWRVVVFLMLFASLYLSQNYVSKTEYREDQARVLTQLQNEQLKVATQLQSDQLKVANKVSENERENSQNHTDLGKSLILINNTLAVMGNMTDRLSDHENRLRNVEKLVIEINAKMLAMEKNK